MTVAGTALKNSVKAENIVYPPKQRNSEEGISTIKNLRFSMPCGYYLFGLRSRELAR